MAIETPATRPLKLKVLPGLVNPNLQGNIPILVERRVLEVHRDRRDILLQALNKPGESPAWELTVNGLTEGEKRTILESLAGQDFAQIALEEAEVAA